MKAGDYVRTKRGTFDRFITSHTQDNLTWYTFEDRGNITNPENYVIKSSPNIIDLIEVGDFITYEKDNIYINIPTSVNGVFDETTLTIVKMVDNEYLKDVNIKSIITHEQMESIKYKLGE